MFPGSEDIFAFITGGLLSTSCSLSELSEDEVDEELEVSDNLIFLAAAGTNSTGGTTWGVANTGIEGAVLGGGGWIGTGDALGSVLTVADFLADFLLTFFVFSTFWEFAPFWVVVSGFAIDFCFLVVRFLAVEEVGLGVVVGVVWTGLLMGMALEGVESGGQGETERSRGLLDLRPSLYVLCGEG